MKRRKPKAAKPKYGRADLFALLLVTFMAGFATAFGWVSHSAERRVEAEAAKNIKARQFMAAAQSPDVWDDLLNPSKR